MKKVDSTFFLLLGIALTVFSTTSPTEKTLNDLKVTIVGKHTKVFGVDNLITPTIDAEELSSWFTVVNEVDKYIKKNYTDIFGVKDATLDAAMQEIIRYNKLLCNTLFYPYRNTKDLIEKAQIFLNVENQMKMLINKLQKTTFILKNKKNAQQLLLFIAEFIEVTAKKANKDTRMGHQKDTLTEHYKKQQNNNR